MSKQRVTVFSKKKFNERELKHDHEIQSTRWPDECNKLPPVSGYIKVGEVVYSMCDTWCIDAPLTPKRELSAVYTAIRLLERDFCTEVIVPNSGPQGHALGALQDWLDEYEKVDSHGTIDVYSVGDKLISVDLEDVYNITLTVITSEDAALRKIDERLKDMQENPDSYFEPDDPRRAW